MTAQHYQKTADRINDLKHDMELFGRGFRDMVLANVELGQAYIACLTLYAESAGITTDQAAANVAAALQEDRTPEGDDERLPEGASATS